MANKFFNKYLPPILLILFNIFIFRSLLTNHGLIFHMDTAPFNFNMGSLRDFADFLWVERYTGLGMSTLPVYVMTFFALEKIYSLIYFFNQNQVFNNILWVFLPFPILILSIYTFIKGFVKNNYLAAAASCVYFLSYVFFNWFLGSGSNILALAVSGAIIFCYAFIKILDSTELKDRIKYIFIGSIASLFAVANIAYFYVFCMFALIYFGFSLLELKNTKGKLISAIYFGAGTLATNVFWIAPIKFMGGADKIGYGSAEDGVLSYASSCSSHLKNIAFLYCHDPAKYFFYIAPIIAALAIIAFYTFKKKDFLNTTLLSSFLFFLFYFSWKKQFYLEDFF